MSTVMALPRINLHSMLVAGIRDLITQGELRPGEKVSEAQLCKRFDVSRTPLREALKVLAAEGMVELRPRRGAVVASLQPEEIDEIFPIMAALEALAGEMLCKRATPADVARLQALHDRLVAEYKQGDEAAYLLANRAFHETVFELADNPTLRTLYAQILTRIRACRFVVSKTAENWRRAVQDHEEIMQAIQANDGRRLSRLLRRHVNGVAAGIAHDAIRQIRVAETRVATTP